MQRGRYPHEDACVNNFRLFADSHFVFEFPNWGLDQAAAAVRVQEAVLKREVRTITLARGRGKTSLAVAAALWTARYGHSEFTVLIGPTERHARWLLEQCRFEARNSLLLQLPTGRPKTPDAYLHAVGICGSLRGLTHRRAGGTHIRPSLVIVDEIHTATTVNSATQCARREMTLRKHVLALGGMGQPLAAIIFRGEDDPLERI